MKLPNVSSQYGAPMGRRNSHPGLQPSGMCRLRKVAIDSGGYDNGGAYWGVGAPLYLAEANDDDECAHMFFRALNREIAKGIVRDQWPDVSFYN